MKKQLIVLICIFLFVTSVFSGCNEFNFDESNSDNDGGNQDFEQPEGCPTPEEVDQLEQDFDEMRSELAAYLNDTEYEFEAYSTTRQRGVVTEEGRQMRLDYEEFREEYLDVAFNKCEDTDGVPLEGGSAIWLKGNDLTRKEIHPEYFLDLPFYRKDRILYEEPNFWSGETTDYFEYQYQGQINGYKVIAKIYGSDVGGAEDQWQYEIEERNLERANYEYGDQPGSSVYYTNYYEDEYGRMYKGIYFQIFGFAVYAGYYGHTNDLLGTDSEYFNDIEITEDFAKETYEYLVYRPGFAEVSEI